MSELPKKLHHQRERLPPASRNAVALVLAAVTAVFFGAGYLLPSILANDAADRAASTQAFLPQPHPVPDFVLRDQHGRTFTRERLGGKWTLVVFGYTRCPDVCALALDAVREALDEASRRGLSPRSLQAVFVSVDPSRDTPARLREYLSRFDRRIIGVSGDEQTTDRLARGLGVAYERRASGASGDYVVDHTTAVLLVGPRARLVAGFPLPLDPGALADGLETASRQQRRAGAAADA